MPALIAFPFEASDESQRESNTKTTTPINPTIKPDTDVNGTLCDQNTNVIIAAKKAL
ncbi:MAG: hypothetical protein ACI9E4_000474 [Pseudohongiellaceae bacterium]|jgi:hypothetical protein